MPVHRLRARTPGRVHGVNAFIARTMRCWNIEDAAQAHLLGCTRTRAARIVGGTERVDDEPTKERVRSMLEIRGTLWALFRDETVENEWLREAQERLGGTSPLETMTGADPEGLARVEAFVWHTANPGGS